MKQALRTTPYNPPPENPFERDPYSDPESVGSRFLKWLKHFALYLGAVTVACATGLYFLWQIPLLHDLPQLLKNAGDTASPRPLSAALAPPVMAAKPQATPPPTFAPTMAAVQGQPPVPTGDIPATNPPPVPSTEAPGGPATPEQQATPAVGQTDPSAPLAEASAEDTTTPPTPGSEIEQLLADAQQQMDSRRFTAPTSGNALRTYQHVLELEPNNPAALDGIQRIATYYRDIARQSLQQGRTDEGLAYINRGLRAAPKDENLLNLRREVRLTKQREQEEQQQALLEEIQRQQAERDYQEQFRSRAPEVQQPWRQQPPSYNDSGFNQR